MSPLKTSRRERPLLLDDQFDHRRAEDMARLVKHGRQVAVDPLRLVVGDRFQQGQRPLDVAERVERLLRILPFAAFLAVPLLFEAGVFRLDLGRIAEQQVDQIGRGAVARILPRKPSCTSLRQQAAMVDVGVGQQHDVDVAGPHRGRLPSCGRGTRVPGTCRNRRGLCAPSVRT